MYIVNNEQMRRIEKVAFDHGMPEAALMEKAGCAVAARIIQQFDPTNFCHIAVLAGTGHNGADALVVARELLLAKRKVSVWCANGDSKPLREAHKRWFSSIGGNIVADFEHLGTPNLIVDGLLGFGTTRPPSGEISEAIDWCNSKKTTVVSIDNPSGLCTDTGHILGNAIRATLTFCLGVGKEGLFHDSSAELCGDVEFIDIGLSELHIARILNAEFPWQPRVKSIQAEMISELIPIVRKPNANKFSSGRALIVAGSYKYPGAAIIAALGCKTGGAGYIVLDAPDEVRAPLLTIAPNLILDNNSSLGLSHSLAQERKQFDAVLCGPGLDTQLQKLQACLNADVNVLCLDADALNMISRMEKFPRTKSDTIITPHAGEFARLFPDLARTTPKSSAAAAAAKRCEAVVVYKGPRTVIAHPDGRVFINTKAKASLARAGTGDFLAGLIVSYAAQGLSAFDSAIAAVWEHAQDRCSDF